VRKLTFVIIVMLSATAAVAKPSSFVEGGYITGGENGENGAGRQDGLEVAGRFGINETWYIGGALGHFDRQDFAENDYLNVHVGTSVKASERTDFLMEFGFWTGSQDLDAGGSTDPKAVEARFGFVTRIGEQFSGFGAISLVAGDLDTDTDSDLRNFVWTAGFGYAFTKHFSLNLRLVEGSNGVNGQSDVARIGGRWTF
jgi:hypothetical protein